ncbi:MAG: ADP-heptose synthase [Planctomycetaceae bacterium]|nr:MAG: ADP-heptose synthase [Planctomycetaceae bacterium]
MTSPLLRLTSGDWCPEAEVERILAAAPQRRCVVLGDFFLDKYLAVDPQLVETSLETGKPAHQVVQIRRAAGAAGTVVNNLAALGVQTLYAVGVIGDDGEGYDLRQALLAVGCDVTHLVTAPERFTPTYLKPHDTTLPGLAGEHSRYDTKNRHPLPSLYEERVLDHLERLLPQVDAVMIMDQVEWADCGVITQRVRERLATLAEQYPQVWFWADSRRRIREFRHCCIKPNQFEAVGRFHPSPSEEVSMNELEQTLRALRSQTGRLVCITCGERGMLVSDPVPTWIPAVQVSPPIDPTGAGDSATAAAVIALAAGATPPQAALLANLAASVTIRQLGTTGMATPDQIRQAYRTWLAQQHPDNSQ